MGVVDSVAVIVLGVWGELGVLGGEFCLWLEYRDRKEASTCMHVLQWKAYCAGS